MVINIMGIKLIACDVDGTLADKNGFTDGVAEGIAALLDAGVKVALASGRSYHSIRSLTQRHPFADELYYICDDGALSVYRGRVLFRRSLPFETLRRFEAFYTDLPKVFFADTFSYVLHADEEFVSQMTAAGIDEVRRIGRLFDIKDDICKLGVYQKDAPIKEMQPLPPELRVCYTSEHLLEYNGRYADKGAALSDLLSRLFIDTYDAAAMGDGANDTALLKKAKYTYARSTGDEALRRMAGKTFDDPSAVLAEVLALRQRSVIV